MKKGRYATIEFSRGELVHMRRFLTRGMLCAEGKCPGYTLQATLYVLETPLKKIKAALASMKSEAELEKATIYLTQKGRFDDGFSF